MSFEVQTVNRAILEISLSPEHEHIRGNDTNEVNMTRSGIQSAISMQSSLDGTDKQTHYLTINNPDATEEQFSKLKALWRELLAANTLRLTKSQLMNRIKAAIPDLDPSHILVFTKGQLDNEDWSNQYKGCTVLEGLLKSQNTTKLDIIKYRNKNECFFT